MLLYSIESPLANANDINYKGYGVNTSKETVTSALAFLFIAAASFALNPITLEVYAEENSNSTVVVKEQGSYVDSLGRLNIVGVVYNDANKPVSVKVGINVMNDIGNSHASSNMILTNDTYARIIYPSTSVPFKFVLESGQQPSGKSFIESITEVDATYYDVLHLNYTNMAIGTDKALFGNVKNVAPFAVHNVSVYASVHKDRRSA